MLIIFTIAIFCSNNIYATNENQTGNETDLTNNSANSSNITEDNNTNSELTYHAAGENFTNIRGFWISTDVNNLDVNALQNANVTDVFVKTNLISNPTYSTTLNTVIQKLTGTGIRIHAWITCFKDADGNWINPANTTQRTFLLDKIKDIARNYNIDGIHLDYVRYPGTAYNYSNGTETITSFVEDVYDAVKGIKAKLMISAAVMPECGQNAYYYGQDYTKLAPYLDFLVPMIYKGNYNADTSWIGTTTAYIVAHSNGTPVVSGLQTYRSDSNVTPIPSDELKYDISSALSNGSSGYVLFRYGLVDNNFFNLTYFTIGQITDAAASLKAYVERYYTLPANVTINGTTMNMAQFLELMMTATQQINNKNNNPILLRTFNLPTNPLDDIKSGNIQIAEYLKIANDLKTYMDSTGKTPDYQYQTSLGTHLGFQNLVYMYSFILYVNKVGNYLLNFVPMKPWSSIGGQSAGIIPNGPTFTIDQIKDTATTIRNYVESKNKLPDNITINGTTMNMAQFLELMMTATLQLNSGNNNPIPLRTYNLPNNPLDDIKSGNIQIAEYLKIANDLKIYMDSTGKTPDYQYQTSLGTHLGFQNLVYMYSWLLYVNKVGNYLPNYVPMKPWSSIAGQSAGIILNGPIFTIDQIKYAATTVKNQVESSNNLPANVTINGTTMNMAQFLELMMTATLQLNSGNNNPIPLRTYNLPNNPLDDIKSGNIQIAEYLKIANDLKTYMDSTGKTPDYQYQTSLGTHLGFQNLIYTYSKILNFYNSANYLPNFVEMKPWAYFTSPTLATFSIVQIADAGARVKTYVETNKTLPNYVTISNIKVNMSQFLELLMTATLQINSGSNDLIALKNYTNSSNPVDDIKSGNLLMAEYLKIANDLKNYMDSTGKTPDYQYQTSLGTHLGFQNLVYMYSKILNFYNSAKYLPNFVEMKAWNVVIGKYFEISSDLSPYLQATLHCEVNDPSINSLAWSLALGGNGINEATKIFNWVRDYIDYSFYYDTKYGAAGTLYWMEGNCVDTAHLLVALERAAGIPARYEHVYAQFSSGTWYGHVIAQVYVNGAWYDADACSYSNTFGHINNWNTATATYYGIYASLPF